MTSTVTLVRDEEVRSRDDSFDLYKFLGTKGLS